MDDIQPNLRKLIGDNILPGEYALEATKKDKVTEKEILKNYVLQETWKTHEIYRQARSKTQLGNYYFSTYWFFKQPYKPLHNLRHKKNTWRKSPPDPDPCYNLKTRGDKLVKKVFYTQKSNPIAQQMAKMLENS